MTDQDDPPAGGTPAIEELPPIEIPGHRSSGLGSDDHPMRIMTRRAAGLTSGGWNAEARENVSSYFDQLADAVVLVLSRATYAGRRWTTSPTATVRRSPSSVSTTS